MERQRKQYVIKGGAMAEHLGQKKPPKIQGERDEGFNAMGKPIPIHRKRAADQHLKAMGITDVEDRFRCIAMVAARLEHDDPYGAQHDAMKYIDLTGSYRLMAVLLTGDEND
jgi:hypothetical protein